MLCSCLGEMGPLGGFSLSITSNYSLRLAFYCRAKLSGRISMQCMARIPPKMSYQPPVSYFLIATVINLDCWCSLDITNAA